MEKYGIDYAAVKKLLESGECATEEEALEKVASGRGPARIEEPHLDLNVSRAQIAALGRATNKEKDNG
jgi:hypothetical protein